MRSFSNDLSPIHSRDKHLECLAEEMTHRLETDHSHTVSHNTLQDERIATAARALVYLFSPQIDLINNLDRSLQQSDKYQKTTLILKQLLTASSSATLLQQEVMRTSDDVARLEWQIQQLNAAFQLLEEQNKIKDQQILKYRNVIIDLSEAYQQAKYCFTDEIRQQKYEIEELRAVQLTYQRKGKSKHKKVRLDVPYKENEAYTDRSIYQRVSATHITEEAPEKEAPRQQIIQNVPASHISYTHHQTIIQRYQLEREALFKKIKQLEENVSKMQQELKDSKQSQGHSILDLQQRVYSLEAQIKTKNVKIRQKNSIIAQLLDAAERRFASNT